jgi:hypothetical protein
MSMHTTSAKPPFLYRFTVAKPSSIHVGLARTICMWCIYDVFGREITKYKVMHGVDIQLWPTLFHNCESKPGRTTYQVHRLSSHARLEAFVNQTKQN